MKPFSTFKSLGLPEPLSRALEQMGFVKPTPVQAASIPPALLGRDVLGTTQTGTGKTGAFCVPLLAKLQRAPGNRAVVLAPTRELAAQIHKVLAQMAAGTSLKGALLVGGEPFAPQKAEVEAGADYFVGTPGRLIDHLEAGLRLTKACVLVLDEVDRMLDMGFAPQLMQIAPYLPAECQTLLFSATLPKDILPVVSTYLHDPVRVSIGATTQPHDRVKQINHQTTPINKNDLLLKHLKQFTGRVVIFTRTQRRANKVLHVLQRNRLPAALLHGGRSQGQRKEALEGFRNATHRFLVATDLAGRGIDVSDVECVINYDLPLSREDYIHRIGRTARNGKSGTALNYLTPSDGEGKDILTVPESNAEARRVVNKPGAQMGGWESRGGRNKPVFRARSAQERYGAVAAPARDTTKKEASAKAGAEKKRRPEKSKRPLRNAAEHARNRKLGIAGNSRAAQVARGAHRP